MSGRTERERLPSIGEVGKEAALASSICNGSGEAEAEKRGFKKTSASWRECVVSERKEAQFFLLMHIRKS